MCDGTAPCPKTASFEYSEQVIRRFIYNAVILHQVSQVLIPLYNQ